MKNKILNNTDTELFQTVYRLGAYPRQFSDRLVKVIHSLYTLKMLNQHMDDTELEPIIMDKSNKSMSIRFIGVLIFKG